MAEEGGFEPPSPLQVKQFSRLPHSTALPPLHGFYLAERWGFEPQMRFWRIHDFQSCSFGQLGHLSLLKLLSVIATLKYNGALLIEQVPRQSFLYNLCFRLIPKSIPLVGCVPYVNPFYCYFLLSVDCLLSAGLLVSASFLSEGVAPSADFFAPSLFFCACSAAFCS